VNMLTCGLCLYFVLWAMTIGIGQKQVDKRIIEVILYQNENSERVTKEEWNVLSKKASKFNAHFINSASIFPFIVKTEYATETIPRASCTDNAGTVWTVWIFGSVYPIGWDASDYESLYTDEYEIDDTLDPEGEFRGRRERMQLYQNNINIEAEPEPAEKENTEEPHLGTEKP